MTDEQEPQEPPEKKPRGMAALSPEERRRIASLGGHAVQRARKAPVWTKAQAHEMARKGGTTTAQKNGGTFLKDIGRLGGIQKGINAAKRRAEAERNAHTEDHADADGTD